MMMERFRGKIMEVGVIKWVLMIVMVVFYVVVVSSAIENGGESNIKEDLSKHQKPNAVERAMGLIDHMSVWGRIISWIRIAGINFSPPVQNTEKAEAGPGEVVRDAATRSFEKSRESAEKSAKVAGDVVHKTVEKVKRTVSSAHENMEKDL